MSAGQCSKQDEVCVYPRVRGRAGRERGWSERESREGEIGWSERESRAD